MTTTLPDLKALASPDAPDDLEWKVQRAGEGGLWEAKVSPTGIISADDNGVVTLIPTVTGIVDEVKDVIEPGAYTETLAARIPKGVWSHDWSTWVGRTDDVKELMPGDSMLPKEWKGRPWPREAGCCVVQATFNLGTQPGREAYSNVRFFDDGPLGPQVEFSIGYRVDPARTTRDSKGWRRIGMMAGWFEWCPVLFGAMPLAGAYAAGERKSLEAQGHLAQAREQIVVRGVPDAPVDVKAIALEVAGEHWTPSDDELKTAMAALAGDVEEKVAGRELSPSDVRNTERLKRYWAHGPGAAKIRWGVAGDFDRCRREVGKYLKTPGQINGYCALRHHDATGAWPGHAPTEQVPGHKDTDATGVEEKGTDMGEREGKGGAATDELEGLTGLLVDEHEDDVDDDPDDELATGTDPDDPAYPTGEDDDGAAEGKAAAGAMKCGKSRADCPHTMADDSYPIHDAGELADAVASYPRGAGKGGKTKKGIRAHIARAGRRLGKANKVPRNWPEKHEGKSLDEVVADAVEAKDYPYIEGSVEERQAELRRALQELLLPDPDPEGRVRAYVSLDATFADRVVATLTDYSIEPSEEQTFKIPYTYTADDDGDGTVEFGDPEPVEKVVSVELRGKDDEAAGGPTQQAVGGDGPLGGANPLLPVARKLGTLAKSIEDALSDEEKQVVGDSHMRRLRSALREVAGVAAGMDIDTDGADALVEPGEKAAPDDETKSLLEAVDALLGDAPAGGDDPADVAARADALLGG